MITSKMLYLVQDERELAYMYAGPDAAYCINGREIRMPVTGGIKVFIDRDLISQQNNQMKSQTLSNQSTTGNNQFDIEQAINKINERIESMQNIISELSNKNKEESLNEKPKGNGARNSF